LQGIAKSTANASKGKDEDDVGCS